MPSLFAFRRGLLLPLIAFSHALAAAEEAPLPAKIEFNRDVRPILSENCFKCHGFDEKNREAHRRLDVREGALSELEGVRAIVPGDLAASDAHGRIHSTDRDEQMPPPKSGKKLSERQRAILDRWIEQGAGYQQHWAYIAPTRPPLPAATGKNAIDALIGARLVTQGLAFSPQADRRTLIRRLSLDLLGLPPSPAEIEAFVNDPAPGAYEKLLDALLASPHYGERMALPWLDVTRFADTAGYHSDNPRNIWPYRDYVIAAFNSNKPFDQFTLEQLAGDLLPASTQEQKVASAFNRLLLTTEEGGAQSRDYESRMLTDRVRAVGTVWLGQTLGCAQCHDHKFDPISSRDFYAMGAFFADITEPIIGAREKGMLVFEPAQKTRDEALSAQVAKLEAEFNAPHPELLEAQQAWETALSEAAAHQGDWSGLTPTKVSSEKGNFTPRIDTDGSVRIEMDGKRATRNQSDGTETLRFRVPTKLAGITGFRLEVLADKGGTLAHSANGNFVLNELSIETEDGSRLPPAAVSATFAQASFPASAAVDGNSAEKSNGWAVLGGTGSNQALIVELRELIGAGVEETTLTFVMKFGWGENHVPRHLRLSATTQPAPAKSPGSVGAPGKDIVDILKVAPEKRAPEQREKLGTAFKKSAPQLLALRTALETATKNLKDFEGSLPTCLVSIASRTPRTVRMLPRGNWMDESGAVIEPALPHYLPQPPREEGHVLNRLDLARWLVSKDNPLTARVFVNRLWKQFFGLGLSKVLDDLGAQGEVPIHGELLDWLAVEFMESGWDVRHLVKLIVQSDAYRQVSTAPPELLKRDPYNRELARQSRWRLDAELVRDNALSVSGLLSGQIGGPSVKPYQPENYWENLNFPVRTYVADAAPGQYRRGLYTWWQRSYPHPSLTAFDAPSREECNAERNRSNIPQQALVLLNDPTFVEAARALAARILLECTEPAARLQWAFRQTLGRDAAPAEIETLAGLLEKNLGHYRENPAAAAELLKDGIAPAPTAIAPADLAAWTQVSRVLLNLHETITRS